MKSALLATFPLLLAACATKPMPTVRVSPRAVPGTTLPSASVESVRYAENIKAYPLGRYIDPNNSRIMHEGHAIYRVETTGKWNLHPNQPVLGALVRSRRDAGSAAPMRDELTAELNRQREATRTVVQGSQVVSQKLDQLAASVQQTRQFAEQNAQLRQEFDTARQRLDRLEEDLRKAQRAERSPAPAAPPRDDKSDW